MNKETILNFLTKEWLIYVSTFLLVISFLILYYQNFGYFINNPKKYIIGFTLYVYPFIIALRFTVFSIQYLYKKK